MAADGEKKLMQVLYEVDALCLSKLEPLAVCDLAHTYVAADQNQISLHVLISICHCAWTRQSVYTCQVETGGEESMKINESMETNDTLWIHFFKSLSKNWNAWLQIAGAFFLMATSCQVRLLSYGDWKVNAVWFASASLLSLRYASGRMLLLVTGGRIVWVWLSFLRVIRKARSGDIARFLMQSLTIEHTFMIYFILALSREEIHFYLCSMAVSHWLSVPVYWCE